VFGQGGEPAVSLINVQRLIMRFGHKMEAVIHNTQGDLVQRGYSLQLQEVVELENANANLQVHLHNITGFQVTAAMSISHVGHARR
jgi:hypothetical protein